MFPWCADWWVDGVLLGVMLENFIRKDYVLEVTVLIIRLPGIPWSFQGRGRQRFKRAKGLLIHAIDRFEFLN